MEFIKKLNVYIGALTIIFTSCNSHKSSSTNEYSLDELKSNDKMTAELKCINSATFDFGNINAGGKINHTFYFKNIGHKPLIIISATASCGCTVAKYDRKPVEPNQSDSIVVVFVSTKESLGYQSKVITVTYNNSKQSPKLLTLFGRVN